MKWWYELRPTQVWTCWLITPVPATGWDWLTCCCKLEGMAKSTKCVAANSNHRVAWTRDRGLGAGSASPSKLVAKRYRRNNHELSDGVYDICEAVERRDSVNTGYCEQKSCTAFMIKHRFLKKKQKKNSGSEKNSRASRYFILSSSKMIRLQRGHLMLKGTLTDGDERLWFSQSVPWWGAVKIAHTTCDQYITIKAFRTVII